MISQENIKITIHQINILILAKNKKKKKMKISNKDQNFPCYKRIYICILHPTFQAIT